MVTWRGHLGGGKRKIVELGVNFMRLGLDEVLRFEGERKGSVGTFFIVCESSPAAG
jgi:hypothetical protein